MPELVEVELARRALDAATSGRPLAAVEVLDPRLQVPGLSAVGPWRRRGKQLYAEATSPSERGVLLVHLGMTGQWRVRDVVGSPAKHTRLRFVFADSPRCVDFIDPRRFGDAAWVTPQEAEAALARLGPDAWEQPWGVADAQRAWRTVRAPLQHALMDQQRLAGLGNIASTEIAWRAGLHPLVPAASLSAGELARLLAATREHLAYLFDVEGDDELIYVSMGGRNPFKVYGRAGEPCPSCGTPVLREVCRGRSAFLCPSLCQRPA